MEKDPTDWIHILNKNTDERKKQKRNDEKKKKRNLVPKNWNENNVKANEKRNRFSANNNNNKNHHREKIETKERRNKKKRKMMSSNRRLQSYKELNKIFTQLNGLNKNISTLWIFWPANKLCSTQSHHTTHITYPCKRIHWHKTQWDNRMFLKYHTNYYYYYWPKKKTTETHSFGSKIQDKMKQISNNRMLNVLSLTMSMHHW